MVLRCRMSRRRAAVRHTWRRCPSPASSRRSSARQGATCAEPLDSQSSRSSRCAMRVDSVPTSTPAVAHMPPHRLPRTMYMMSGTYCSKSGTCERSCGHRWHSSKVDLRTAAGAAGADRQRPGSACDSCHGAPFDWQQCHVFARLLHRSSACRPACHKSWDSGVCTCRQRQYERAETPASPAACQLCARWCGPSLVCLPACLPAARVE